MSQYVFNEKGRWYFGLLVNGASIAFKLEDEDHYKLAVLGKPFQAYHVLLFLPGKPMPDYLAAKGGTQDPWVINGYHLMSINPVNDSHNEHFNSLMKKTIDQINGVPQIQPATAMDIPGKRAAIEKVAK